MAIIDDNEEPTAAPVDELVGRLRVKAKIVIQADIGEDTAYGLKDRKWDDRHTIDLTFGPEANRVAVSRYIGHAVSNALAIHVDPDAAKAEKIIRVLEDQLNRILSEEKKGDSFDKAVLDRIQAAGEPDASFDQPVLATDPAPTWRGGLLGTDRPENQGKEVGRAGVEAAAIDPA